MGDAESKVEEGELDDSVLVPGADAGADAGAGAEEGADPRLLKVKGRRFFPIIIMRTLNT